MISYPTSLDMSLISDPASFDPIWIRYGSDITDMGSNDIVSNEADIGSGLIESDITDIGSSVISDPALLDLISTIADPT